MGLAETAFTADAVGQEARAIADSFIFEFVLDVDALLAKDGGASDKVQPI